MSDHYAVVGSPIAHSLSPNIHHYFAKCLGLDMHYERIEGDGLNFEQQVLAFFAQGGKGLNITSPFKERAYAMAKHSTLRCAAAKAANTLWMKQGQLHADTTDGPGLLNDLHRYLQLNDKKILLLGAGGAARGVIPFLLDAKPERLVLVNRTHGKAQALRTDFPCLEVGSMNALQGPFDVIINARSNPDLQGSSLPEVFFKQQPFCYDLAYHPSQQTAFVACAREFGCQAMDGLGMLIEQAALSFEIWTGVRPDVESLISRWRAAQNVNQ